MSEAAESKSETILEQFSLRRLYPRHRLWHEDEGLPRPACAVVPSCCEFAVGIVSERSEGRICSVDDCYCSPSIFKNPIVYLACEIRLEKLKEQAK